MHTLEPSSGRIEERLTKLFPTAWIEQRARDHRVLIRDRKLDPTALVWSLVLGFAIGSNRSIEELRRTYIRFADHYLCPSSFHDRLTNELAALLRNLIDTALQDADAPHTMADQLDRFRDLVVADSTVVQLRDLLADTYPATHDDRASAKLHLVHNVTDGTVERLDVSDGRTHDSRRFKNGSWLDGRLLLFDLGYFSYHRFVRIDENGGFFVSRLKRNANPEIVEELRNWCGNAKPLVGEDVWDVVEDLHRSEIDALVEIEFKRRSYAGSRSSDTATFRLVGLHNDTTGEYHCYLTNLPAETFDPAQVAALYRARWEIELLFRELKSTYGLDELPSSKPAIVEVLLLASVLTLVVSRVLLGLFREVAADREDAVDFPRERVARVFESFAPLIANRLAQYLGYGPPNLLELMYRDAQKQQSRPLLLEQVNATLAGDSCA
jgi:IS4 transposase